MTPEFDRLHKSISKYLELGWSVFPVEISTIMDGERIKKIPRFPVENGIQGWKSYQLSRISPEDITFEWVGFSGIGLCTGKISGITVVDLDCKDKSLIPVKLWNTYTVETRNGYHLYFQYCEEAKQTQEDVPNIDIRNDGGFVFAPPTEYELPDKTIAGYKIINAVKPAPFPIEWYRKTFNQEKNNWKNKLVSPITEGSRNMDFASIVGGLLQRFPEDDWDSIVWKMVENTNKTQQKPLSVSELKSVYMSIAKKELTRRHTGGDIKDIATEVTEDEIRISITLEQVIVCFKVKNIVSNLLEANVVTWIKKTQGLTHEMPYYLKIKSDSNKEQWARILSKAYDKKESKEVYPWTILVSKATSEIEKIIREYKQDFLLRELTIKPVTWMYEPFIQEDQINTFFGLGSSGKTVLSLYFSTLISSKGVKTLLVDFENDGGSFKDKMIRMMPTSEKSDNFVYFESGQIPVYEQVDKIKEVIKRHGIKLVIIDSASMASGDSTSDEASALRLISAIKLLKTTTILIAHQRKTDGDKNPIGSIQFENQSRNVWNFKSIPDDFYPSVLHVACKHTKANNTFLRKDPIGYKITFNDIGIDIASENAQENFDEKFSVMKRIQHVLKTNSQVSSEDIADELDIKLGTIKTTLTRGKTSGFFTNKNGLWSLRDNFNQ